MTPNFKDYLKKKKAQKIIDKFAKKYSGKDIILYGAGLFATELLLNYDFSRLNIVGIADLKFQDNDEGYCFGYKKVGPYDLNEKNFDVLLIINYDDEITRDFIEDAVLEDDDFVKIEALIKLSWFDYIKKLIQE